MAYYLASTEGHLAIQMLNFASKIETYAATFALNGTETGAIRADAAYYNWALMNYEKIDTFKKNWTGFKSILLKGEGNVTTNTMPVVPTLDGPPAAVPAGVLHRFTAIVKRVKAHPAYTTAIGQNLGIEAAALPAGLLSTEDKPQLKALLSGEHVILKWTKGHYNGILIEKDNGNGFAVLDKDFMPDFADATPLPQGTPAIWRYRAIYLLGDDKVGQWSDVVSITVG